MTPPKKLFYDVSFHVEAMNGELESRILGLPHQPLALAWCRMTELFDFATGKHMQNKNPVEYLQRLTRAKLEELKSFTCCGPDAIGELHPHVDFKEVLQTPTGIDRMSPGLRLVRSFHGYFDV